MTKKPQNEGIYLSLVSQLDAHFAVSRLLGHERADVTNVYLASLRKEDLLSE